MARKRATPTKRETAATVPATVAGILSDLVMLSWELEFALPDERDPDLRAIGVAVVEILDATRRRSVPPRGIETLPKQRERIAKLAKAARELRLKPPSNVAPTEIAHAELVKRTRSFLTPPSDGSTHDGWLLGTDASLLPAPPTVERAVWHVLRMLQMNHRGVFSVDAPAHGTAAEAEAHERALASPKLASKRMRAEALANRDATRIVNAVLRAIGVTEQHGRAVSKRGYNAARRQKARAKRK